MICGTGEGLDRRSGGWRWVEERPRRPIGGECAEHSVRGGGKGRF